MAKKAVSGTGSDRIDGEDGGCRRGAAATTTSVVAPRRGGR